MITPTINIDKKSFQNGLNSVFKGIIFKDDGFLLKINFKGFFLSSIKTKERKGLYTNYSYNNYNNKG